MKIPVNPFISNFLASFLCSFSQIMLQKNVVTGLLFVVGIGLNSPIMLLGATLAVLSALFVAQLCQYDSDSINTGLYGFNAALVGAAVFFFFSANLFSFTLVILVGAISTVIMNFMLLKFPGFPVFTVPFLVSTWLLLQLSEIQLIETVVIDSQITPLAVTAFEDFYAVMRGVGQVFFQGYWLSGVVFIAGLLLHSYKVAAWAIIGSVGGVLVASTFNFPEDIVNQGLYGFNASLSAIALAQRFTKTFSKTKWPILLGILISVLLTRTFELLAIPALTAPFVLASWLIIIFTRVDST